MQHLADYAAEASSNGERVRSRSCLYVAKGPTAIHALEHLSAGDVATVNSAGLLFPQVDWSFWCDVPPPREIGPMRDRCRRFVVPDRLHTGAIDYWRLRYKCRATVDVTDLPPDKTLVYPYDFIWYNKRSILRNLRQGRVPMCMTAPAGLYILARYLGYRRIWCFGHDGGRGHASGMMAPVEHARYNYDVFRRAMEIVAEWLRTEMGTTVCFWPDLLPEEA